MSVPPRTNVLSVAEVTRRIRLRLEGDPSLAQVWIRGEISNYRPHVSGHAYFTLKDSQASLRCVMFRGRAVELPFQLANGLAAIVQGRIGVYDRDGAYQLYVEQVMPDGVGSAFLAFEQLKARLDKEGLFAAGRKRRLPRFPRAVGVVTSPSGAALRDILTVSRRRYPGVRLILAPAAVQGESAAAEVARGIALVSQVAEVDVVIVARGGGSLEELSAFNSELVARAIHASPIPVVSAVGHETDFTIADLVADVRAPTPSAGAEISVPSRGELKQHLSSLTRRGLAALAETVAAQRERLRRAMGSVGLVRAPDRLSGMRQRIDQLSRQLASTATHRRERAGDRVQSLIGRMHGLSPLATLARGYAICRDLPSGKLIRSARVLTGGDRIALEFVDGAAECLVDRVRAREGG
ncbi:MAG TPA: exodeoxyribonuclease VII large subunit [Bacillota bacterium]|nr:exodeoxyribonuclease VII large subunit [Bacillota bacterium]